MARDPIRPTDDEARALARRLLDAATTARWASSTPRPAPPR